ncbi:MAG: leucyl aminopeptidase family protein [Fimbriimonadaceae bacterium]
MFTSVEHISHPHPEALIYCVVQDGEPALSLPDEAKMAMRRPEFKGKRGQIVEAFPSAGPRIIILGLGAQADFSVEGMRKAGLKLAQHIDECEIEVAQISVDPAANSQTFGQAFGVAIELTACSARQMPGSRTEADPLQNLKIKALDEEFDKGLGRGLGIGKAVNFTRRLVNTPPNIANPYWMAAQAEELASRTTGLSVRVIKGEELEKERMIGHINVGKGSNSPPCMIRIEWMPEGKDGQKPIVLIGKTITFDTGGLSIKSKTGMPGMKYDKSGGCAVLGTMQAVAEVVKPDFPVVALLVAAENSISSTGYRPDDVITYRNGVTVEVTNTDAEGRLVLADGLCWACDLENPDCIVDIATLTGAAHGALGGVFSALFGENDAIVDEVSLAGKLSGEELWRLPVNDSYRDMMNGTVSDVVNSNLKPAGAASAAAGFLTFFCRPEIPYAHIDMAGLSHTKADEYTIEGPSGWGVRLLTQFIASRMENK